MLMGGPSRPQPGSAWARGVLVASSSRDLCGRERVDRDVDRAAIARLEHLRLRDDLGDDVVAVVERGLLLPFAEEPVLGALLEARLLLVGDDAALEQEPADRGLAHHLEEAVRVERDLLHLAALEPPEELERRAAHGLLRLRELLHR